MPLADVLFYNFSIGILTEITHHRLEDQRVVFVNFPDNHQWQGLFDELAVAPDEELKVCDD